MILTDVRCKNCRSMVARVSGDVIIMEWKCRKCGSWNTMELKFQITERQPGKQQSAKRG